MNEDIIEAVARALYANEFPSCDAPSAASQANHWQRTKAHYLDQAETAITAYEAARGDVVVVPREITPAMAHALESNYAECIPPSMIHVANWRDAYRAMIAASQGER